MPDILISRETADLGLWLGLMRDQGAWYELTEKGSDWVHEYCQRVLFQHSQQTMNWWRW